MSRSRRGRAERLLGVALPALAVAFGAGVYALTASYLGGASPRVAPASSVRESRGIPKPAPRPLSDRDLQVCWVGRDPAPRAVSRTPVRPPGRGAIVSKPTPPAAPKPTFRVRGIIYEQRGDSVAFIESEKDLCLKRRGERIQGWRVVAIDRDAVTFIRGSRVQRMGLADRRFAAAAPAPSRPPSVRKAGGTRRHARGKGRLRQPLLAGAPAPRGLASFEVATKRRNADAMVAVPASLIEEARKDPVAAYKRDGVKFTVSAKDGRMDGVILSAVPKGSLTERFGFAAGDKIVAVNGQPLDSPARALTLYNSCRDSNAVTVTIERGGNRRNVLFYGR